MAGTSDDRFVGRTLGDFILRRKIGAGGFGAVYLAEQPALGREAVIKVPLRASGSAEYVARFLREARVASRLDHPYAAHIYAFGSETDGTLWTAMELVRGVPLNELLADKGPLPLERFVPLFEKICEVVHTAHEQGIVHRDIKPANVMVLTRAGQLLPKLLDLGIAKIDEPAARAETPPPIEVPPPQPELWPASSADKIDVHHTRAGKSLGSPAYMAPEQWVDARRADARADIYALGILAYESLTGRLPFAADTVQRMAYAHAFEKPVPLGGGLPAALDAVIAIAMAKKAADRYGSALDLAAAVNAAVGASATPIPEFDPFLRDELIASAPQPLAEALAALDGVRNLHQARTAVVAATRVTVRLVGGLALACQAALPSDLPVPAASVEALRRLRKHGLADDEWLALARTLVEPMAAHRDRYALPDLIDWCVAPVPADGADATPTAADALGLTLAARARLDETLGVDDAKLADLLTAVIRALERALRPLRWLARFHVTMPRGDFGERWSGVRRPTRAMTLLRGATTTFGRPVFTTDEGDVALPLWPLFQIAAPAPGHAEELFVLDGPGRGGARLLSLPTGFERADPELWAQLPWLAAGDDSAANSSAEKAPYRGLAAFTAGDADLFVGREREAEAFANRLRVTPLLAVVGPSGAGKSSFIQAGVMPLLGEQWVRLVVRPGGAPMRALEGVLRGAGVVAGEPADATAALDGDGLGAALRAWATTQRRQVLLYIDQFEELFTLCHDAAERDRFVDALLRATLDVDAPVRVVLTVRDDFLLRCQQLEPLRDRLVHGLQLLATPTPDDLHRIIVEPARRVGYAFDDPALPGEMVAATAEMAAALPLLSFTALQLWDLRDRATRTITRKAYDSLGGVGGALAQHAERVLGGLSTIQRGLVRVAFRNLVTAEGTRAVLTRQELMQLLGSGDDGEVVLEAMIGARLLSASEGAGGLDRVEVVHEALLSAWPRLLDWRREDADGARLRDQLRAAARQWHERGRPRGLLWRDEALTEYQLWRIRQPGPLTDVEHAFGAASDGEALRGRRIKRAVLTTIGAILAVGMIVSLVLYRRAEAQRAEATAQRTEAQAQRAKAVAKEAEASDLVTSGYVSQGQRAALAGDGNQALVYLAAARARGATGPRVDIPLADVRRTMNAERMAYRGHARKVWALTPLPDGTAFASSGADGVVNVWSVDATTPRFTWKDATDSVFSLAVSPDGSTLAVPSWDGHLRLYDLTRGVRTHDLALDADQLFWARFLPDGRQVIGFGIGGPMSIWDVATGTLVRRLANDRGVGVPSLSTDGRWLATGGGHGSVSVWNVATGQLRWRASSSSGAGVWPTAFSPDGSVLATGAWDGRVTLWDAARGVAVHELIGHTAGVDTLAWRRDGTQLASGGRDGAVRVWSRDGALVHTLQDRGFVYCTSWSPDGTALVACVGDAAVVWDARTALPRVRLQGHGTSVFQASLIRDGAELLSAGGDGNVKRWTTATAFEVMPDAHASELRRVVPCDGGTTWLTLGEDGTLRAWDAGGAPRWTSPATLKIADVACAPTGSRMWLVTSDGRLQQASPLDQPPTAMAGAPTLAPGVAGTPLLALDPGATRLAMLDGAMTLRVLDLATGALATGAAPTLVADGPTLRWTSDGRALLGANDRGVVVWDPSGQVRTEVPFTGTEFRGAIASAPDQSIFVWSRDYAVQRFSLADGRPLGRFENDAFPTSLAVNGSRLLVGLDDGAVVEFDIATGKRLNILGTFGTDVVDIVPVTDDLMWISTTGRVLSLFDRSSTAVLHRQTLAAFGVHVVAASPLALAIGGEGGSLSLLTLDAAVDDPERIQDELDCRVPFALDGGVLRPRDVDLTACDRLAQ